MIPVKEFFTGGRAIFTVEVPESFAKMTGCRPHYTYRIHLKKNKKDDSEVFFVSLKSGPEDRSWAYLGIFNNETGQIALTKKSIGTDDCWSVRFFRRIMANIFCEEPDNITEAGFDVHHEGKCGKCGRPLTVPESVKTGLGPICSGKK
jgi:hypothetical protein